MIKHSNRLAEVRSWQLIAHLASRVPGAFVVQYLFEGGHYDSLEMRAPDLTVTINRPGSVHMFIGPQSEHVIAFTPSAWRQRCVVDGGIRSMADDLAERCSLDLLSTPRSDSEALWWQVVARLLASRGYDSRMWSCSVDDRASAGPDHIVWALKRGGDVIATVLGDVVTTPQGRSVALEPLFKAGATIDELVAKVTRVTKP